MNQTLASRVAAAMGMLAVVLGAFGAHGLKELFAQNGMAGVWEKAVFYHFIHAVMLFVLAERKPFPAVAWWSFLIGIIFFSGSLYLLAVTNVLWLGAVTPVGGVSFLVGWDMSGVKICARLDNLQPLLNLLPLLAAGG